ncbi:predicted protein [Nematostella vectensis]|uniref:Uncharacterized protein n=1 Tax=Nematostella vectensis TaxID=45351 RepID=A7S6I8_NEMVE|nr:predicted protein [Nematostella vectensis]|eukprot:XP_001632719.1 predicted protein [Nematostella vectensis]
MASSSKDSASWSEDSVSSLADELKDMTMGHKVMSMNVGKNKKDDKKEEVHAKDDKKEKVHAKDNKKEKVHAEDDKKEKVHAEDDKKEKVHAEDDKKEKVHAQQRREKVFDLLNKEKPDLVFLQECSSARELEKNLPPSLNVCRGGSE